MGRGRSAWLPGAGRRRAKRRTPSGISTTGPKPWLPSTPAGACPVPAKERDWIEKWLHWCAGQFGAPAAPRRRIALPGFVPADFTGTQEQTEALVRRVGAVMGADVADLTVLLVESSDGEQSRRHRVGQYRMEDGHGTIELDVRVADRPDAFAGLVAHELAHARLLGEQRTDELDLSTAERERLTDLTTVFLGMGVLTANAADDFVKTAGYSVTPLGELTDWMLTGRSDEPPHQLGYLTPQEFGYALACWSTMRGETDPPWARRLTASVRAAFTQGLAHRATA